MRWLTVEVGEAGDAIAVRRSLAFTVTHVLCNVCTASKSMPNVCKKSRFSIFAKNRDFRFQIRDSSITNDMKEVW